MVQEIKRPGKRGVEVYLGKVIDGFVKGVGRLLGFAAKLEEEGKDKYVELGEITGRTKSGKDYTGAYGFRMKVGLNPEDFRERKK